MPSKIKNLYKKAKKGLKNIALPKKHKKVQEANDKPKPLSPEIVMKPTLWQKKVELTSKAENIEKDNKWKIKVFKTKHVEKDSKRGKMFKNGLKKLKGKLKSLNPIKAKKNKIIGSKKLAFLLTAGTIVAILPMFNLTPFPALAITSACVFSINFIAVKTLKKAITQRKAKSKTVAEPEKLENVSVEQAKEESKQVSKDLH
ncbi:MULTISPECIES: hypothetical protein [unclassified Wolbachia]|uniref:hypothetical protein n=2 Tax=Wolbachia TaxID=953 RepID=UPI00223255BA|nr:MULTISPECIES: hypothetical protein [unclassified Wolbachia]